MEKAGFGKEFDPQNNEHSEKALAPNTHEPRDVPRSGALNLLRTKAATLQGDSEEFVPSP